MKFIRGKNTTAKWTKGGNSLLYTYSLFVSFIHSAVCDFKGEKLRETQGNNDSKNFYSNRYLLVFVRGGNFSFFRISAQSEALLRWVTLRLILFLLTIRRTFINIGCCSGGKPHSLCWYNASSTCLMSMENDFRSLVIPFNWRFGGNCSYSLHPSAIDCNRVKLTHSFFSAAGWMTSLSQENNARDVLLSKHSSRE